MDEEDQLQEVYGDGFDDHLHQACYVFRPTGLDDSVTKHPAKKRKLNSKTQTNGFDFPPLLNGDEPESYCQIRQELFHRVWDQKEKVINSALNLIDHDLVDQFTAFVADSNAASTNGKLPTGILVSGSDSNSQQRFLNAWRDRSKTQQSEVLVRLQPSQCPNLQTCLRNVIKLAITENAGVDAYNGVLAKHKKLLPLNFDLELLHEFVKEYRVSRIVISITDAETFDMSMIMAIISSLHSWIDRIPFVLIIGLATTVELLEGRLSNSAVKLLETRVFELASPSNDPLYEVFKICQNDVEMPPFLGPAAVSALCEVTQNQGATVELLKNAIKYIYMSHFFSNPLSVLLSEDLSTLHPRLLDNAVLCEAIRNTDSFHHSCEEVLDTNTNERSRKHIRALLEDDETLLEDVTNSITVGSNIYSNIASWISILTELRHLVNPASTESKFETATQFYQRLCLPDTDLANAPVFVDEITPGLRKLQSKPLLEVLTSLPVTLSDGGQFIQKFVSVLRSFQASLPTSVASVRSSHDASLVASKSLTKAGKATASPATTNLDKDGKKYTVLLDTFIDRFSAAVSNASKPFDVSTPLMCEAYIFNLRQPLHASLIFPRPRHCIERALSRPADYLSCGHDACSGPTSTAIPRSNGDGLNNVDVVTSPPDISLLYSLLQEAPTVINVRDLFDAFCSRRLPLPLALSNGADADGDEEENIDQEAHDEAETTAVNRKHKERETDRMLMALFYRALAELKLLGLVKPHTASATVKKKALQLSESAAGVGDVDFIAKTSWFGL